MKKAVLLITLFTSCVFSQQVKFGWISNISELADNQIYMDSLLKTINSQDGLDFMVFTNKLTKGSEFKEYDNLNEFLSRLRCNYYLLPSPGETAFKGLINFREFWWDLNFFSEYADKNFLGISAENFLNNKKNTYTPETINWITGEASDTSKQLFLFTNSNLDQAINSAGVIKELNKSNLKLLFSLDTPTNNSFNIKTIGYEQEAEERDNFHFYITNIKDDSVWVYKWEEFTSFEETEVIDLSLLSTPINPEQQGDNYDGVNKLFEKKFNATLVVEPLVYEDKIFICERKGIISCIDSSGNILWDYDAFGDIIGKPAVAGNKLVVSTFQGDIITIDLETGESIQTIGFEDHITSNILVIDYNGDKQLFIPKQTDSKAAFIFGTSSGKIYCYDLETLQQYWVNEDLRSYIYPEISFDRNRVLCTSAEGNIACIDTKRGWLIWKWNETVKNEDTIYQYSALVHNDMVFVASTSGYVYGINMLLGKTEWRSEKFRACNSLSLSADEKKLLVKVYNEKLILLSQKTGTNLNVIRYSGGFDNAFGFILNSGNYIYVTSGEGEIFKISNFKKSDKVLGLGNKTFLGITEYLNSCFLLSSFTGEIILIKFL